MRSGAEFLQPAADELGLLHRETADDHALHAGGEQRGDLGFVANAAAGLHAQAAVAREFFHERSLALGRILGAVEVDDMQPGRAGRRRSPAPRRADRRRRFSPGRICLRSGARRGRRAGRWLDK